MPKKKRKSTPPIGMYIQGVDGVMRKAPSIVDPDLTLKELVKRAFDSDYTLHIRLRKKDEK